ncbi:lipopolysaccharide biosynthesis protein [Sphingobacterium composti Ten et al. 2007 non Yoo et al. 2007]|uniref:lipopolysaccharide biosynthesis protein n=1 Tax=Sphingobacterium composti TaxID=363260 RepID=UPI00135880EA|nr:oligosaccharide flippase family protein [Sphingobacterium composti Ten et al. 2007 non Yoo et al. 2007]
MLKKIFSYGLTEAFSKGLNKLTVLVLPLLLSSPGNFGIIGLIISIETILPFITLLGLERAILRFYSDEKNKTNFINTIVSSINIIHLVLLTVTIICYFSGINTVLGLKLFPDLVLVILLVFLQGMNTINLNLYRVNEQHKTFFKNRIFLQLFKFTLVISLIYFTGSYLGYLIGACIAALFTNVIFKNTKFLIFKIHYPTLILLLAFSWPFIFHGIAGNILGNADRFIIEKFLSIDEVGIYTLAYSYGSSIVFAFLGITVYLEPLIYKQENLIKRYQLLNNLVLYLFMAGIVSFIIIVIIAKYFLPAVYTREYSDAFTLIPLLAASFLAQPFYFKANYLLIYNKKTKLIATISVFSSLLSLGLNYYSIPMYGILASVYCTLVCNLLQYLMFTYAAESFKVNYDILEAIVVSLFIVFYVTGIIGVELFIIFVLVFIVYKRHRLVKNEL